MIYSDGKADAQVTWPAAQGRQARRVSVSRMTDEETQGMGLSRTEYSSFQVHRIQPADMDAVAPIDLPFNPPGTKIKAYGTEINEPAAQVAIEDFLPGSELSWVFPHDEVQYCLSGRAEIEIHMPPLYQDVRREVLEAGCVYLLPQGSRMRIKVLGDAPFRHVCVCFPNPSYPFEDAASIKARPPRGAPA